MKFLRAELHNHSTESDGALTTEQLTAYAAEKRFGVLALTDHNTVSGHAKVYQAIRRGGYNLSLLPGVEITTFYGHVLALGLVQMPDFTSLDPRSPEPFFAALRAAGARAVGIAHPFCLGSPLYIGCRFEMDIHDWNAVDYIEVVNTSASESGLTSPQVAEAFNGNPKALALWEKLVLEGRRIAAVTGKDLHRLPQETPVFTTYAMVEEDCPLQPADAVLGAILRQRTLITKGPLFSASIREDQVAITFDTSADYLGWNPKKAAEPLLELRDSTGAIRWVSTDLQNPAVLPLTPGAESAVVKLYDGRRDFEHLLAVGAPLYRAREEKE